MSDLDDKGLKDGEFGESFAEMMKKVVEKQLEEENAVSAEATGEEIQEETPEAPSTASAAMTQVETQVPDVIIKSENAVSPKAVEVPVFEWKEPEKPVVENYQAVSEIGVISSNTSINGTVSSKGHIRVEGSVIGDIFAYGDVKVTGKVAGDVEGGNIELGACIVDGDVKARGDVTVGKDSTLAGNMSGQLITIDGKIKGDVDAVKGAHMSSTSLVKGSITAPTLSMSAGAELQGKVNVSKDDIME
jgi:cytoskeletal protein CcmA (bactofilin family)